MTLSKQQLETISLVLNNVARCHILGTLERSIYLGVDAELYRLAHGPYSLPEAIASGRPFRRKGRSEYITTGLEHGWVPGWLITLTESGNLSGAPYLNIDDITACDYELQEGGE